MQRLTIRELHKYISAFVWPEMMARMGGWEIAVGLMAFSQIYT
jgi:hypothetical protein